MAAGVNQLVDACFEQRPIPLVLIREIEQAVTLGAQRLNLAEQLLDAGLDARQHLPGVRCIDRRIEVLCHHSVR